MAKYVFPAIFTPEKEGGFSVNFPDIVCFAQGEDMADAIDMAKDALCLTLYDMEERKESPPEPSDIKSVKCDKDEFVTLISCDTLEYRRYFDKKAVKKTLTIPSWLNDLAVDNNINFSNLLQTALMKELNVEQR